VPVLKSFADGRLFGGTWGSGVPSVLALHGWRRTHADFTGVFDADDPPGAVSAIGLDLSGFGASPPPPEPWGTEEYASQLLPLFEEPGALAERIVVVGHSFGGRVAVHLGALVPERIERMVLCGVPLLDREGPRPRPAAAFRVARRLHSLGLLGDDRMEEMRGRYGSADYRAAKGVMRDVLVRLLAEQYREAMAAVRCPVELIWGEEDTEVPVEVAVRATAMFPSARLVTLPGIGHLLPTEAPRELREAVLGRDTKSQGPDAGNPGPQPAAADDDPMAGSR
jgi:pimeloyl-ACP methyl ester carboxylesterase